MPSQLADILRRLKGGHVAFDRVGAGGSAPITYGYEATLLVDIADFLIEARDRGLLSKKQELHANYAQMIIRAVAKVGIVALVDEATGYQEDRAKNALAKILEAFIAKGLQPLDQNFPSGLLQRDIQASWMVMAQYRRWKEAKNTSSRSKIHNGHSL